MSYILKTGSSGLINVRLTDAGRKKLSQGKLTLNLFQFGDSEMCYNCYTDILTQSNGVFITEPKWNAQNISNFSNELNKMDVKYPIPITDTNSGQTYGVLTPGATENTVYNTARQRGFFSGNTTTPFSAITNAQYVYSANWCYPLNEMTGGTEMVLFSAACNTIAYTPVIGDLIMVQYINPFQTTTSNCNTSYLNIPSNNPVPYLFYQVVSAATNMTGGSIVTSANTESQIKVPVDRELPNYTMFPSATGCSRVLIYPPGGILNFYGEDTPIPYWSPGSLSFDNNCDVSVKDVKVWNMNINWTQVYDSSLNWGTVAGVNNNTYGDVNTYGSSGYCGTKEWLGYNSNAGQYDSTNVTDFYSSENVPGYQNNPIPTSGTYIRDSFGKIRTILPDDQRCIAILHYSNETISNFYGEKFALEPTGQGTINGIGESRNFKIHMPTLMWHKKKGGALGSGTGTGRGDECTIGQTFYVNPPGFENVDGVKFIASLPNPDMNEPGIRYYHLWDDNVATISGATAVPNRVGKVFPDLQIIVIDDQELVAAMTYKSNRNWTLPMPRLGLIEAGQACATTDSNAGFFNGFPNSEQVWVSYLLENHSGHTTGLHCNYYTKIIGDTSGSNKDVVMNFGDEFPYIRPYNNTLCGAYSGSGVQVDTFNVLFQKTPNGVAPDPAQWQILDISSQVPSYTATTPLQAGALISSNSCSFYLTADSIISATTYNLHDYINIPLNNNQEPTNLQFGDEYFFYGSLDTDIMATIYEMRYSIAMAASQFTTSQNPTWSASDKVRITEIGLFDTQKDLMAIAKLKNPTKRVGIQNFQIKIDF